MPALPAIIMLLVNLRWTVAALAALLCAAVAEAAPRVEMVLIGQDSSRQWYQMLVGAKVDSLQIRPGDGGTPKIEVAGTAAAPIYQVTGIITRANELALPGGRFSARDSAGVIKWLNTLRSDGPARAQGAPRLAFGFSKEQLMQVSADLARPVDFSTTGATLRQLLERLGQKLTFPLLAQANVAARLTDEATDDLNGVSIGTALACLLRAHELVLVPEQDPQRRPQYMIASSAESRESWPIGWSLKKAERDVAPDMFELVNVEIDDIPLAQLVSVIGERIKLPVLIDHSRLAAQKVDLKTKRVSLPAGQAMYASVLRKTLFSARLKYELRMDDADRPFVWITSTLPTK